VLGAVTRFAKVSDTLRPAVPRRWRRHGVWLCGRYGDAPRRGVRHLLGPPRRPDTQRRCL